MRERKVAAKNAIVYMNMLIGVNIEKNQKNVVVLYTTLSTTKHFCHHFQDHSHPGIQIPLQYQNYLLNTFCL